MRIGKGARLGAALVAGSLALAGVAYAGTNKVKNGGFEKPVEGSTVTNYGTGSSIGPWHVVSGNVDMVTSGLWQPAKGIQSLDLNGDNAGAIEQSVKTVAGTHYQLSFRLSGNPFGDPAVKDMGVSWNGVEVADETFDVTGHDATHMGWTTRTVEVVATGATSTVGFASKLGGWYGPAIDVVKLTALG
jgi:choice-of-anchor C domain-containing protein